MTDTSEEVAARYRSLLMEKSGGERLQMACSMFDSARRMVIAGLSDALAGDTERGVALFLRLYGTDFDADTRDRIIARIRADRR
ncbi:MAG TPA: hypothetical protein VGR62_07385 [Candidatus Binatia bacterium]|jgi:hypothetical protein|nr:hypothetical protein [Candidatus Binatia bacterium]